MSLWPAESLRPTTAEELSALVVEASRIRIYGSGRYQREVGDATPITTTGFAEIIEFSPADQVVTAEAGVDLRYLQHQLRESGQFMPSVGVVEGALEIEWDGTLGGLISSNDNGDFTGTFGTWRDLVLGMTVVLADGKIVSSGSRVVKSVAGYDLHKLYIGARGTLGIITAVTLKTLPIRLLDSLTTGQADMSFSPPTERDATMVRLMKRAKEIFDPTHKLNPGEMGIF